MPVPLARAVAAAVRYNLTTMHFSIIIPTLNEQDGIEKFLMALQPFRQQSELILADGGSTDRTITLASPWVDLIINCPQGRAIQMNQAASHARGDSLIFIHADTFLPENALSIIQSSLSQKKLWGRFNIELVGRSPLLKVIGLLMNYRSKWTGIATGDQVIFVTKALFNTVGHYPNIALMEDIALCSKLKQYGPPACIKAKVHSSARRWEQFGLIKTILLMWSLRLRYYFGTHPDILAQLYYRGQFWSH